MTVRIGTRGSKLALWQANLVADLLKKGGISSEIISIETKGDKMLNKAVAKIGSKGVFTAEIEEKLVSKEIDIAVHSAKDLQSELPEGLEIIAYTKREIPHDVLVSFNKDCKLSDFDRSFVVGSSSTRRVALLKHHYPHIRTAESRGNLQTRMKKLEEGYYDALILAYAGMYRMNYQDHIVEKLPLEMFIPAVGQGAIAVEANTALEQAKLDKIRELINHTDTETCIKAERAYLRKLQGGCSVPIFALATLKNQKLDITGGVVSMDGQQYIKESFKGTPEKNEDLGVQLADKVIELGGKNILEEIRKSYSS